MSASIGRPAGAAYLRWTPTSNDQVRAIEEMRIVLDLIGEAGVVLLGNACSGVAADPRSVAGEQGPGRAEDNGVRRGVVPDRPGAPRRLDQLMNRRVSQGDGAIAVPPGT